MKASCWRPGKGRSGLSAEFSPQLLLDRAKARRNFSDRFDKFSDAYIWVLAAIVALAYLFSVLFGAVFVLLGEGTAAVQLGSALFEIADVTVLVLPLAALALFSLLLKLGPCGVSPATADWWLALPLDLDPVRRRTWLRAGLLGAGLGLGGALLWFIVLLAVAGSYSWLSLAAGCCCGLLAGAGLAWGAVLVQERGARGRALRICRWLQAMCAAAACLLWAVLAWAPEPVAGQVSSWLAELRTLLLEPAFWGGLAILAAVAVAVLGVLSRPAALRLSRSVLRAAGKHQSEAAGALAQVALPALEVDSARPRRKLGGHWLPAWTGPVFKAWLLRLLRGGYWKTPVLVLALAVFLLLAVQQIANPMAASGLLLALLACLCFALAGAARELLASPQLVRLLGLAPARVHNTVAAAGIAAALIVLLAAGVVLLGLGLVPAARAGWWLLALAASAVGLSGAVSRQARKTARDWSEALSVSTNDMAMGPVIARELSTVVHAAACAAPAYFMLLVPGAPVPWALWGIALACSVPAWRRR